MPIITRSMDAKIGPKNLAVFIITKNSPPARATRAFSERDACLLRIQFFILEPAPARAQKNIASHERGMVKTTLMSVAFIMPNILVVAINDPSTKMNPSIASNIPAAQYNFLYIFPALSICGKPKPLSHPAAG